MDDWLNLLFALALVFNVWYLFWKFVIARYILPGTLPHSGEITATKAAIGFLIIGTLIGARGYLYQGVLFKKLTEDFYANVATELISVAITVLIIDKLNQIRSAKDEQKRIIAQIGSRSNDFALEAVRLASERTWLTDGTLKNINFSKANLERVELIAANLIGVNLSKTNLTNSDLSTADLTRGNLERANLAEAELFEANLVAANLVQANFKKARLNATRLMEANLTQAILIEADLTAAILNNTKLMGVQFNDAILINASLVDADLTGATMVKCDLYGANLNGSTLNDVNFSDAIFFETTVVGAKYNKDTIWPEGFDPKSKGAILTE